jgi:hypothetical protein
MFADLCHMVMIGSATTTEDVQVGKNLFQLGITFSKFTQVAAIQFFRFIKFSMTFLRGV